MIKTYDDGAFTIDSDWKGSQSYDRDGKGLIFSGTEWECEYWTRRMLKEIQEGTWNASAKVINDGVVGGKL